jgi:hypothetical protein
MNQLNLLLMPEDVQPCEKTRFKAETIKPSEIGKKATSDSIRDNMGKTDKKSLEKYDINDDGVIDEQDIVDFYAGKDSVKVSSPEDVAAIENKDEAKVVASSTEGIQALSNQHFKEETIVDGQINQDVKLIADTMTIDGLTVAGEKGASNGKINFKATEVTLKNITAEPDSTVYNVFEGSQVINDPNYTGLEKLTATDLNFLSPSLAHNVINVYTPANGAVITIKNSKFDLNVDNSNVIRMANYLNSENVTINFENVEWTYENASPDGSDWGWAGLMIFQPASQDVALAGDISKIATWKVNVKNCKYNGKKVTVNNFGEHNQVVYLYNVGNTGAVSDASKVMKINFK